MYKGAATLGHIDTLYLEVLDSKGVFFEFFRFLDNYFAEDSFFKSSFFLYLEEKQEIWRFEEIRDWWVAREYSEKFSYQGWEAHLRDCIEKMNSKQKNGG